MSIYISRYEYYFKTNCLTVNILSCDCKTCWL